MKAEFYILGVLHRGDFHPYEIKRRLNNALVECYIDVDVGKTIIAEMAVLNRSPSRSSVTFLMHVCSTLSCSGVAG